MPAFRVSGATGQAPTTSYFGVIPDKFNMLVPAHMEGEPSETPDALVACNFVNQMTIFNGGSISGSFGAFTTAPDGTTNTAQLFVESTGNTVHLLQAALYIRLPAVTSGGIRVNEYGTLTLSGFFKASGRRVTMSITGNANSALGNGDPVITGGCQATFDLANGAIGVAAALFGIAVGSWASPSSSIVPFANGWYRCSVTVVVNNAFNINFGVVVYCNVFLDNGTGSAAASTSYAGNGTSGVYGWRINLMPQDSYGMTGQRVFFDDFLSSSTIDLTNSLAPGFNWYLQHSTSFRQTAPNTPFPPTSASIVSVSGSILSLGPCGSGTSELDSAAATSTALNAPVVGNTYTIPGLFETRMNWDYRLTNGSNANPSFWAEGMKFLVQQPFDLSAQTNISLNGKEYDFLEGISVGLGWNPAGSGIVYDGATDRNGYVVLKTLNVYGFARWQQFMEYHGNDFGVFFTGDGNYYTSIGTSINVPPPSATWTLYSTVSGLPVPVTVDCDDFHVYSVLILPWKRGSYGLIVNFCDGVCTGISSYAPTNCLNDPTHGVNGPTTLHGTDGQAIRIDLQGIGGSTMTTRFDYVSVTY